MPIGNGSAGCWLGEQPAMVHLTYRFGNTGGSSAAQTDAITIMHIWLRLDYITPKNLRQNAERGCLFVDFVLAMETSAVLGSFRFQVLF